MSTILIIVILLLILGVPGGYYAHQNYGAVGLGGILVPILIIVLVLYLTGYLR